MRSLDVTWWPDLEWPGSEIVSIFAEKMYEQVCQKTWGESSTTPGSARSYTMLFFTALQPFWLPSYVPICIKMTKFYLWWPQVIWPLTWAKKLRKQFLNDFWRSFDCRLPRVATWPRSRGRGGGVFRRVRRRAAARLGSSVHTMTNSSCSFLLGCALFRNLF